MNKEQDIKFNTQDQVKAKGKERKTPKRRKACKMKRQKAKMKRENNFFLSDLFFQVENVRVRRAGFAYRRDYNVFLNR